VLGTIGSLFIVVVGLAYLDPEPAGQRRRIGQLAGGHHRLGVGWHEHRAGRHVRPLHQECAGDADSAGSAAPRGRDGQWRHHTLPHNGAVITLLAVTGLTHRESYREIFAITVIKTLAVFFVIAVFYLTNLV
jgi:hypothetical protein